MENNIGNIDDISSDIRLIHNILGTIFAVFGFFANTITLISMIKYHLYKDIHIIFIINLVIINCLSSGFSLSYIAYQSFTVYSTDDHNTGLCRFTGYVTYSLTGTEIIAILQISFNRYFLIVHFDRYKTLYNTRRKVIILLALSWLVYFILTLFPCTELWGELLYDSHRFICHPFLAQDSFTRFYTLFSGIISVPPLIFCYVSIAWKIITTRKKVAPKTRSITQESHKRAKVPRTIIAVLVTFVLLYVPYFLVQGIDPGGKKFDPKLHVLTVYLAWAHLICNPVIYAVLNKQIRQALIKLLNCKPNVVLRRSQNTITTIAT